MSLEHLVDTYSPIGDMISLIACVVLLIVIHLVLFFARDSKFSYLKRAVHLIIMGALLNIIFDVACTYKWPAFSVFAIRSLYHFCFMCCLYLFLLYMKKMLSVQGKVVQAVTLFTRVFFIIVLIADAISPVTHFGFHRDGELWMDSIINPYNVFYVYATTLLFVMLLYYADRIIRSVRNCLLATEAVIAIIMITSAIKNSNTLTSFTYVLPIIVVMILLHSRPFDDRTGALSADSFDSFINQQTKKGTSFDYMVLKLNLNVVNKLPSELGKILNSFWHDDFKNALLFHIEHDLFVLAIPRIARNGNTEAKIKNLFEHEFQQYYARFQLQYKVIGLFDIDFIENDSDIRTMIQYILLTMSDNTIVVADEKLREQLKLLREVKLQLADIEKKGDLQDERVVTYCQPIMNMTTGKYDTAEALMRLSLPEKGMIMPYLFIPLAEYYGHIHSLTRIMLNKVCAELHQLEKEGYDFKRVSINFTASDIRMEGFCDEILEIIRANGIEPSKIGIELTETQNESDFMIVQQKMSVLKKEGMTIYLDDVGTGYSNLDRIVRYNVDVVKFDRFFLLEAEKNPDVIHMMKHLSMAFKDLNYSLLYEGVETEENEQLCMSCGAEYIQGFKFSKPIPMEELRGFFTLQSEPSQPS